MKLSVNLVHHGCYVRAGDDLPSDFILPEHLDRFVIYDEPALTSRVDASRFSSIDAGDETGARLAKSAMNYEEGEEEFTPKFVKITKKKGKQP